MSSGPVSEMAYRVLRLEQQLESYHRLHAQELEDLRRMLGELKAQVLGLEGTKDSDEKQGASALPPINP